MKTRAWLEHVAADQAAPERALLLALASRFTAQATTTQVPLDRLTEAFTAAAPSAARSANAHQQLLAMLESLAEAGVWTLPRSRTSWRRCGAVQLPNWVRCSPPAEAQPETTIAWVAPLAFAAGIRRQDSRRLLERINEFLIHEKDKLAVALPLRERSLEIFGDEKQLLGLLDASRDTLYDGRIPLSLLNTYRVRHPLVHQAFQAVEGADILVVENLDTYHSFCRWNEEVHRYRVIAFGNGNAFSHTHEGLEALLTAETTVSYIGDVDPSGLRIPAAVDAKRRKQGLMPVLPATNYYHWLLRHGVYRPLQARKRSALDTTYCPGWLGEALLIDVLALFERGHWIPQESLSYAKLQTLSAL